MKSQKRGGILTRTAAAYIPLLDAVVKPQFEEPTSYTRNEYYLEEIVLENLLILTRQFSNTGEST
jgi:hypothetical protein